MFQPGTCQMCNAIDVGSGYWFSIEPILLGWIAPRAKESSPRSLANLRLSVAIGLDAPVARPKPIKGGPDCEAGFAIPRQSSGTWLAAKPGLLGSFLFVFLPTRTPTPLPRNDCFSHSVFAKFLSKDGGIKHGTVYRNG